MARIKILEDDTTYTINIVSDSGVIVGADVCRKDLYSMYLQLRDIFKDEE